MKKRRLRSGYTTGACAAAAAKAAVMLLFSKEAGKRESAEVKKDLHACAPANLGTEEVEIPFPDNSRVKFRVQGSGVRGHGKTAWASVIKDAGDDPDVTHRAEIVAEATGVRKRGSAEVRKKKEAGASGLPDYRTCELNIKGGEGVGVITKPGLPIPVGEPAINPVPRKMIEEAVLEAVENCRGKRPFAPTIEITISVPDGEALAKKTLNYRLGIVGGISILGTTGIVKPVSSEAWTATITSSMDVAKAAGLAEIVLSAGRSSEKSHMKTYNLPEESYVLMGDYLEYSLREAKNHAFEKIHLCAQWAKMLKIAMATPQTHVRFGAINIQKAVEFLASLDIAIPQGKDFNTAREIYDWINERRSVGANGRSPLRKVCTAAKKYTEKITGGIPVTCYLVSYKGEIVKTSE